MYTRTINVPINPNSLRQRMIALAVGEVMFVSMEEHAETTVRNYASTLCFTSERKYTVARDKERRGVTVTREA